MQFGNAFTKQITKLNMYEQVYIELIYPRNVS